jgi:NAD(P)-dependent dehydrogenase (short-subunit alcohol dehydrogenase family)
LDGKVAIVTGAGRGIGASVARLLAANGARVVVSDLGVALDGSSPDEAPADGVTEEIRAAGGEAVANHADVADYAAGGALVRQAIETFGGLDVLVNVAGILRDRMVFNMSEEEWDAVVRVHLRGTFVTTRHAAAHWRERRDQNAHNRLINFTSVSGLHGAPGQPNYAAAKMGIVGLTYSCANALAPYGVTANAISPGAATRMTESVREGRPTSATGGDERSPDNVAPIVAYLASDRSDWCTGQVISARGYEVGLYDTPHMVRQIASSHAWDPEQLAELVERNFRPVVTASRAQGAVTRQRAAEPPRRARLRE